MNMEISYIYDIIYLYVYAVYQNVDIYMLTYYMIYVLQYDMKYAYLYTIKTEICIIFIYVYVPGTCVPK